MTPSSVNIFKHLLLWNHRANWTQISYRGSLGWGNQSFFQMVLVTWPRWPPRPYMVKPPLKIFFTRTRRPMILGLGMLHLGCGAFQVCSNDDPRLTLTYLKSRSNLLSNAFKWEIVLKSLFFWKLLKPKSLFSLDMLNLMRLCLKNVSKVKIDLLAKVTHIRVPSTHLTIFSESTCPIVFKFHMKTPYDRLTKNIQIVLATWPRWLPCPYKV